MTDLAGHAQAYGTGTGGTDTSNRGGTGKYRASSGKTGRAGRGGTDIDILTREV